MLIEKNCAIIDFLWSDLVETPETLSLCSKPTLKGASQAVIKSKVGNHHAVCHAAMINYAAADWKSAPPVDQDCAACIVGPNP